MRGGHADVENGHVGVDASDQAECLLAVTRLSDHFESGFTKKGGQPFSKQDRVFG
jgi:hypothetical protein